MSDNSKTMPSFVGHDFNNLDLLDAKSLQLNQDATNADQATRKSQVEQIAALAAQQILVALSANASNDTAFTSASILGFLANKQDNMEIHPESAAYLQITDGYKIKATQLLITGVKVIADYGTLQEYLDGESPNNQEGDAIIFTSATDSQERSWIKNSTASQTASGYTRLQTDYNIVSIRAMFSVAPMMTYDAANGQYGLDLGLGGTQLGAQTMPIDPNQFSVITGSTVLEISKALETLVINVQQSSNDGTAVVDTRLTTISGVSGNSMAVFLEGLFPNNATIKALFQTSEGLHQSAITDRALIRNQFADADTGLQQNIDAERVSRISAIHGEAQTRAALGVALQQNIDTNAAAITSETQRAIGEENALSSRLDIVEGPVSTSGSIAKAQADAQVFTLASVGNEAIARITADQVLQEQINALGDAVQYKGRILSSGRIQHKDVLNSNDNALFENASFEDGDLYRAMADITITFADGSEVELFGGDSLVALVNKVAGSANAGCFHVWDNTESADILRQGNLNGITIEQSAGFIQVVPDSITRTHLAPAVETAIDNKVLKSGDTMTGALKIDKTVLAGVGYAGGYDFAAHIKMKSVDTAALTDTQRGLLIENEVYTNGSGNPAILSYAHGATVSSHYKGSSTSMSVAVAGLNGEGRVLNAGAAIYATGVYGHAIDTQLGVNTGGTFVAQNGATSNLGVFGFSDSQGALNNRGAYFALSDANTDLDAYRIARVANPLPVQNAALVADDFTGVGHAGYFNGKVEIVGKVIIPSASANNEAINLADIKARESYGTIDINAGVNNGAPAEAIYSHGLNSDKIIYQLWLNGADVTSSYVVEKTINTLKITNASTIAATGIEVVVLKLSV